MILTEIRENIPWMAQMQVDLVDLFLGQRPASEQAEKLVVW